MASASFESPSAISIDREPGHQPSVQCGRRFVLHRVIQSVLHEDALQPAEMAIRKLKKLLGVLGWP